MDRSSVPGIEIAKRIDHTLLKADAVEADFKKLCDEAKTNHFCTVCVNPRWLPFVVEQLKGSTVLPITVVGFPLGSNATANKVAETKWAIANGAKEIDTVIDLGAMKSKLYPVVEEDIRQVVQAAAPFPVKVIIETCYLSDEEIRTVSLLCVNAGAHFVKTSTGFGPSGATAHHIRLIRQTVGPNMGIKASGGVRTYAAFKEMTDAGATRVGSSSSVSMIQEYLAQKKA